MIAHMCCVCMLPVAIHIWHYGTPRDSHSYYTRYLRQSFVNFSDEQDEQRIQQLINKGRQDAEWVLKSTHVALKPFNDTQPTTARGLATTR